LSSGPASLPPGAALRRNLRDLVVLILTPLVAALLPAPLAHRLHAALARRDWWFESPRSRAGSAYAAWTGGAPDEAWLDRHRRLELRDRSDALRAWASSRRTLSSTLELAGDPIPPAPFVGITLHYGPGLWSFRKLNSLGIRASFLSIPMRRSDYPGRPVQFLFESARNFIASRLGSASTIYASDAFRQLDDLLARGLSIVGMLDVPEVSPKYRRRTRWLGREISLPSGLVALAQQRQVPVLAFYVRELAAGGRLQLVCRQLEAGSADPFEQVCEFFRAALEADSAPWHAWSWPQPLRAFEARPPPSEAAGEAKAPR